MYYRLIVIVFYETVFQSKFRDLTKHVGVMSKPKEQRSVYCKCYNFRTGANGMQFRDLFATRLIQGFEKGCYWYIDQDVLKDVVREWKVDYKPYNEIPYKWNAWGIKKDDIFSTGKGNKKNDIKYKSAQLKWLPNDLYQKTLEEIARTKNGNNSRFYNLFVKLSR